MKNFATIPLLAALACLIGTCVTGVLSLAVIIAHSFVPSLTLPFSYYEALNIPALSVLFPIMGMVLLAPIALYLAFSRESVREKPRADVKPDLGKPGVEELEDRFLKAA